MNSMRDDEVDAKLREELDAGRDWTSPKGFTSVVHNRVKGTVSVMHRGSIIYWTEKDGNLTRRFFSLRGTTNRFRINRLQAIGVDVSYKDYELTYNGKKISTSWICAIKDDPKEVKQ